jgi:hypothetical protein
MIGDPLIRVISLAEADGSLLGENVAAHFSAQGPDLGRPLMELVEHEVRRRNLPTLRFSANERPRPLLLGRRFGFVEVARWTADSYRQVLTQKPVSSDD